MLEYNVLLITYFWIILERIMHYDHLSIWFELLDPDWEGQLVTCGDEGRLSMDMEELLFFPSSYSTLQANIPKELLNSSAAKLPFFWWKLPSQPEVEDSVVRIRVKVSL